MATLKSDLSQLNASSPSGKQVPGVVERDGYVTPPMSWARWIFLAALIALALAGVIKVLLS